jgi:hypothetical protein
MVSNHPFNRPGCWTNTMSGPLIFDHSKVKLGQYDSYQ